VRPLLPKGAARPRVCPLPGPTASPRCHDLPHRRHPLPTPSAVRPSTRIPPPHPTHSPTQPHRTATPPPPKVYPEFKAWCDRCGRGRRRGATAVPGGAGCVPLVGACWRLRGCCAMPLPCSPPPPPPPTQPNPPPPPNQGTSTSPAARSTAASADCSSTTCQARRRGTTQRCAAGRRAEGSGRQGQGGVWVGRVGCPEMLSHSTQPQRLSGCQFKPVS
jgi:hypothetical protein